MKEIKLIDIQVLLAEARNSEHKESYRILGKTNDYRIGAGARIGRSDQPSFFLEVLIYLCPDHVSVDIPLLERKLKFLKELTKRGYSTSCQDSNCIACEITLAPRNLSAEHKAIKSMIKRI
jgi:hypothetical protein